MRFIAPLLIFLFSASFLSAQTSPIPPAISYQAVARNAGGSPITNKNVSIQFSILEGSVNGPVVYTERHQTGTGNIGLFTLEIGKGNPTFGNWSSVDWKGLPKFLKVEIDPNGGTNFNLMGVSSFLTVPYAFVADHAMNGDGWGNQTVKTDNTLTGEGTTNAPLKLNSQSATLGQVLKWNGSTWSPANDDLSSGGSPLVTSARISGNGTANSPLDIAGMGATIGQVLRWNGTAWSPGDASGGNTIKADFPLSVRVNGNETILGLSNAPAEGNILVWSNGKWNFRAMPANNLVGGNGIEIVNNQINSTTWKVNGNNVYRNQGNVGIGTDQPRFTLDVHANSTPDAPHLRLFETESDFARMSFENRNSTQAFDIVGRPEGNGQAGRLNFYYTNGNQDIMSLTDRGIVGIGTVDPENTTKLDVVSTNKYAGLFSSNQLANETTVINAFLDNRGQVDAVAVAGTAELAPGKGFGGQFYGGNVGVLGTANAEDFRGNYAAIGVYGESNGLENRPTGGTRIGVYGFGKGGEYNMGVYGGHNGAGRVNWAGYFEGDINVTGLVRKSGGTFVIDHPLDPENKFLYHSFVESPDMMNVYNGNATTDAEGKAIVTLPEYFEALNKDFRYQLTVIGQKANAWIQSEVNNNQFVIACDVPNTKISWQITGIRKDPFAEKNRIQPETAKTGSDRGRYLHPELYGKPASQAISAPFRPSAIQKPVLPKREYRSVSPNSSKSIPARN
jgi:hypothetical protein